MTLYDSNEVIILFQVKNTFSPVHQNHYLFTPRDLTRWCLGFLRYDLKEDEQSVNLVLEVSVLAQSLTIPHTPYTDVDQNVLKEECLCRSLWHLFLLKKILCLPLIIFLCLI